MIRGWIDDREPDIAHIASQRESEQDYLYQRHQQQNGESLPIAQDMMEFLDDERAQRIDVQAPSHAASPFFAPRARRTNTSSTLSAPNFSFSSAGVPSAAIFPSTMIEIRSQYSASSM